MLQDVGHYDLRCGIEGVRVKRCIANVGKEHTGAAAKPELHAILRAIVPFNDGTNAVNRCRIDPSLNSQRPAQPDGWLKVVGPDGTPGPNLESSQEYCRLWQ